MTVEVFGITHASVRSHHFPQLAAFSANSSPSSDTVTEMVSDAGAAVTGALVSVGITVAAVLAAAAGSASYTSCAKAVRMGAAAAAMRSSTQANPEIAAELQRQFDAWLAGLLEHGAAWLGDEGLDGSGAPPKGPSSHITRYGLVVEDEAELASSVESTLRMSDEL